MIRIYYSVATHHHLIIISKIVYTVYPLHFYHEVCGKVLNKVPQVHHSFIQWEHLGEFPIGSYLNVKGSTKNSVSFLVLVRGNFLAACCLNIWL